MAKIPDVNFQPSRRSPPSNRGRASAPRWFANAGSLATDLQTASAVGPGAVGDYSKIGF